MTPERCVRPKKGKRDRGTLQVTFKRQIKSCKVKLFRSHVNIDNSKFPFYYQYTKQHFMSVFNYFACMFEPLEGNAQ